MSGSSPRTHAYHPFVSLFACLLPLGNFFFYVLDDQIFVHVGLLVTHFDFALRFGQEASLNVTDISPLLGQAALFVEKRIMVLIAASSVSGVILS